MSFTLNSAIAPSKAFLTDWSRLEERWDPNYYLCMSEFRRRVKDCPFPIEPLKCSLSRVQYGISERANEETVGVPMLRMINLQDDTWDLSDLKYIEMTEAEKKPYLLQAGDILFNRTNSKELVGKCCVFNLPGEYVFASYLTRVRVRHETLRPEYVTAFLSSGLGRMQIDAVSRQIAGMTNINAEEIRGLSIPTLDDGTQKKVVTAWQTAIQKRDRTFQEARDVLATIDDLLLDELGIPRKPEPPNTLESRIFRRSFSEVTGERLDSHFHRPKFEELTAELRRVPHATMRELVRFSAEQWDQESLFENSFPYIEIGAVDLTLGRLTEPTIVPIAEAANRAKMIVRPGDLLISLTRPTRKAICFAPDELELAVASNGFCIVRGCRTPDLDSRYLFHVLRSRLCTDQFDQRSSGGNYPAITEEQLSKLIIPLAKPDKQTHIAKLLDVQYAKAEELFTDARADLEKAKRDIEALILGKEVKKHEKESRQP